MNRDSYSQKKSKNAQSQKKAIDILINRIILPLSTATNTAVDKPHQPQEKEYNNVK